jgi:two-component system response regulator PhoP
MRILLVDNDGDLIDQVLSDMHQSYVVDVAHSSSEGSYLSEVNDYDAVVVGPSIFDSDRNELCQKARVSNTTVPIAIIPSEDSPEKRILALDSGADVCMKYPVNPPELNAQLRALIRRNSFCPNPVITAGNISLNSSQRKVTVKNRVVSLRKKEYEILEFLIMNKGKAISKEMLLEHLWDGGIYIFSNIIEVHIRNIRLALQKFGAEKIIKTIRGFGYIIEG